MTRVWDLSTGAVLFQNNGRPDQIGRAIISPDGKRVIVWKSKSGNEAAVAIFSDLPKDRGTPADGLIRVWDLDTGRLLLTLPGLESPHDLRFARNGEYLVLTGYEKEIQPNVAGGPYTVRTYGVTPAAPVAPMPRAKP